MIAAHNFAPGEQLNIITHSHGGNVALAASHLGLAHRIDNLITLNKPTLLGEDYVPRENIGNFYKISAYGDIIQYSGSDSTAWSVDSHAINLGIDTSASKIRPHAALIWDDQFRNMWWQWFQNQQKKQEPCARTAAVDSQGNGTG